MNKKNRTTRRILEKKKNIVTIAISTIALMMLLTACGNNGVGGGGSGPRATPNEERIQNDISTNTMSPIPSDRTVDRIEIIEYETDRDTGGHFVFVKVLSNDNEVTFVEHIRISYMQNENREWVLSAITLDNSIPVLMSPLVGAREELAREYILGTILIIDDDEWFVDENILESVTIASQNTNVEQNRDTVTVNVELHDDVLLAEGQMEVEFRFEHGAWIHSDHRVSVPFTTSVLPHAVLELSENELLSNIIGQSMMFCPENARITQEVLISQTSLDVVGSFRDVSFLSTQSDLFNECAIQSISISSEEISDFIFLHYNASNRDTVRSYYSSFILNKELVDFDVYSRIIYQYDVVNGWFIYDIAFTSIVKSIADLEGLRWVGTHITRSTVPEQRLTMEITHIAPDGSMTVIMHSSPYREFSQIYSGHINLNNLSITLTFDEWIGNPPTGPVNEPIFRRDMHGYINANDSSISSSRNSQRDFDLDVQR